MTGAELGYALEAAIAVTAVSTGVWRFIVHNRAELEERATREDRLTRAVEANTTATRELAAEFTRYVETTRTELERMRERLTRLEWEMRGNSPPGRRRPGPS